MSEDAAQLRESLATYQVQLQQVQIQWVVLLIYAKFINMLWWALFRIYTEFIVF